MSIRVLLVDDNESIRVGLRLLLAREADIELVGEAANGEEAVAMTGELRPEVVLLDISLRGMDGLEATAKIMAAQPEVKVIGLSLHSSPRYVNMMREAGARGYVLKETAFDLLVETIHKVAAGQTCFPTAVSVGPQTGPGDEQRGGGGTSEPPV